MVLTWLPTISGDTDIISLIRNKALFHVDGIKNNMKKHISFHLGCANKEEYSYFYSSFSALRQSVIAIFLKHF